MKLDDVNTIVAKVFSMPESEITDESNPETIESWEIWRKKRILSNLA